MVNFDATNADILWLLRTTMRNYCPSHIAIINGRYTVHTDVAYGQPIYPYSDYTAGASVGRELVLAASRGRLEALPTWGVTEPGHAAMPTFGPVSWQILLGAGWDSTW